MVAEQLQQMGQSDAGIILEPEGRNTAPAIALAAFCALQSDSEAVLLVMPADHLIADQNEFEAAVSQASKAVDDGALVTFGVVPTHAETGYGYIKAQASSSGKPVTVDAFVEKPDAETAQSYIESGDYYWNGGIFMFRADGFLAELEKFQPEVYAAAQNAIKGMQKDLDFLRVDAEEFAKSPSISVDYAVMEKTDKAVMVPLDAGWSDVGSWAALWEVSDKDPQGNAVSGDVIMHDTQNSHIYAETKLVTAVGVQDLVIVETDDAVMVSHRDRAQEVKQVVEQLGTAERSQTKHHRKVYRPWGWYDSIEAGQGFQVKLIQVKPGARLSVQMHHRRAEHWVVVKGVAEVLNGDKTFELQVNQSTYIPIGVTHALRNPSSDEPLEIIEVQSGDYLGEDDIVRFEDDYGRS